MLGHVAIESGSFTTDVLTKIDIRDFFADAPAAPALPPPPASRGAGASGEGSGRELSAAMEAAEEEGDRTAATLAQQEQVLYTASESTRRVL